MNLDIESLLKQLKIEKSLKGEVASKFKHVDKTATEYPLLLAAMQSVSERIKNIEAKIKILAVSPPATAQQPEFNTSPFASIATDSNWGKPFTYELITHMEFSRWDEFLQQHATTYHYSVWFNVIKKTFGHESIVLVAVDDNRKILGGLPLTFFSTKVFGKFAVSIPFLNYGGAISFYFDVAIGLLEKSKSICAEQKLSHIEIRTMQAGLAENVLDKKVSMVLELPKTDGILDKQLGTKLRAQYKKAEEYKPVCKIGKLDLLNDFYLVFSRNMRDLGTPVYSKDWFANILSAPEIKSAILMVYMDENPVSAGFLVGNDVMLEIPWASTIQSANVKNANMWMYRCILSYAIAEGYKYFDFGRSTMGAGTYKFKKQWGAIAYQHYWYYILADGKQKPELNPDNPKFKMFIYLWKLMPIWLTTIIGPQIIKHIP
ncbi:MAG: FemAB family XrtA/PEP-CTERM system-associated protein [Pseudomonadota bacterium]